VWWLIPSRSLDGTLKVNAVPRAAFTFFAAFILAIAIGANISVFSFLTAILARPLAIRSRIVSLRLCSPNSGTRIGDYNLNWF
jgi:hypothetical protein